MKRISTIAVCLVLASAMSASAQDGQPPQNQQRGRDGGATSSVGVTRGRVNQGYGRNLGGGDRRDQGRPDQRGPMTGATRAATFL